VLSLLAVNQDIGRAVFHVRCAPARGDLPDNAAACAALASTPDLVTSPKPFTCAGGTSSWWNITISGRIDGHPLTHTVSTCWTPQMAMIRRLGIGSNRTLLSHLLPRREATVLPGIARSFPPGALRPGDLITCKILGHRLESGVPGRSDLPMDIGCYGADVVPTSCPSRWGSRGSATAPC
jgi:hypothetical protein